MEKDFVYANPPLIEVIAEYRWQLQQLTSLPDAAIDPHFSIFDQELAQHLAKSGYSSIETLTPPQVPIELLAHKVVKRYRRAPNTWPLFQAGPGIFAVNTVPPYGGWGKFRQLVADGAAALYTSYPLPERYLKLNFAELRYVNAFRADHGYKDIISFCEEFLNVKVSFPSEIMPSGDRNDSVVFSMDARMPLKDNSSCFGSLKLAPGKTQGGNAAILQLAIRKEADFERSDMLLKWMDDAHKEVRIWFRALTTDAVRKRMGPITELEA